MEPEKVRHRRTGRPRATFGIRGRLGISNLLITNDCLAPPRGTTFLVAYPRFAAGARSGLRTRSGSGGLFEYPRFAAGARSGLRTRSGSGGLFEYPRFDAGAGSGLQTRAGSGVLLCILALVRALKPAEPPEMQKQRAAGECYRG